MKKLLAIIMSCLMVVACCFAFGACSNSKKDVLKMVNVDLSSEQYAFAVKKTDASLLNSVNAFLSEKKTEIDAIFNKYFDENADLSDFGSSTIQTEPTGNDNELVVATNLDFAPFEYTNGNKIAGIDMEIAQLLANYLNKTLVVVNMQFEAVVTSVQTLDTYDIGMAGLTIDEERKEQVNFSDAYFGTTQVLVVKADDATFNGLKTAEAVESKLASLTGNAAKCGGQKATTSQFYIEGDEGLGFNGFANLTFSPYASAALAVQDMINGNISFVVVDKTTAAAIIKGFNN